MKIFDIISEAKLDEFYIEGGDQQSFITADRAEELGINRNAVFRPWGTDTTPWTYSSENMKSLATEGVTIYAESYAGSMTRSTPAQIAASLVNYWKGPGAQEKVNISNMLRSIAQNSPEDAPFLKNEALGIMLNSIQMSMNSARYYLDQQDQDDDAEEPETPTTDDSSSSEEPTSTNRSGPNIPRQVPQRPGINTNTDRSQSEN